MFGGGGLYAGRQCCSCRGDNAVGHSIDRIPYRCAWFESHTVALGFGVNWGHGTLKFKGKEYKFKINGLSVVDLGVSNVSATGEVHHLRHLSDFAGTYNAASAGIAVAAGAGASYLENQHDVVLKITSKKQGVQFTLAAEGLRVKLIE